MYEFAKFLADQKGYNLDLSEGGHPIGKFPHSRKGPQILGLLEKSPKPFQWILEIKLIDQSKTKGAFFEQILY